MPDRELLDPVVLALKAGLSPWHGQLLAQLERIADAQEALVELGGGSVALAKSEGKRRRAENA